MSDEKDTLAVMAMIALAGAMVIWSNASLHGGWTGESLFYAAGLTISGFLSFGGVMYHSWGESGE